MFDDILEKVLLLALLSVQKALLPSKPDDHFNVRLGAPSF